MSYFVANSETTGPVIACYTTETVTDDSTTVDVDVPETGTHVVYKVLLRTREVSPARRARAPRNRDGHVDRSPPGGGSLARWWIARSVVDGALAWH